MGGENHLVGVGYIRFAERASDDQDLNILFVVAIPLVNLWTSLCLLCVFEEYRFIRITNRLSTPYNHALVNVYRVQKRCE
jgi:hypothetical protein